ncbi:hypothetical protein FRB95_005176 [Tulasnella sp. JGI-2019a]|nr:hypothetical protein FRB95_005176 [Tulasnella sp. JGI-2019a]
MTLLTVGVSKEVAKAPVPGPWFKGCFPLLNRTDSGSVWLSALVVQCLVMITAASVTIRTWRASDNDSFLALAHRNGIFHFAAITTATIFTEILFSTAPRSLVLAGPSVSVAVYSIFGSLLLLNLLEQQNARHHRQAEFSTFLTRSEVDGPTMSAKCRNDLELGLPSAPGLSTKLHLTPQSEATTLFLSPCVTVTSRQPHSMCHDAEKHSPTEPSPSTITPSEQVSTSPLCVNQTLVEEERISRPALVALSSKVSNSSLGRRHFSEDSPRTRRTEALQQQEIDEWAAFDEALAQEYDEDGQKRRPRRTHERKWKSDELAIVPPTAFPMAVAPGLRLSDFNLGAPRHPFVSQTSAWVFGANSVTSSSSLPMPPPQAKRVPTRSRLSLLLHRHKHSQESNHSAPAPVPVPVFEESVDAFPGSFASGPASPLTPDSPRLHRSSSTRRSSRSNAARIRRLLATSGGPGSPGSTRTRPRGESDAATICSASTGWAFDNTNTHEAPDFN